MQVHGGEDFEAIEPHGTKKKDIVLNIARNFKHQINQNTGFKGFLTRDGDYFIEL